MEKEKTMIGFSLALFGYVFILTGAYQLILLILILFTSLLSILLLAKDKLPPSIKSIVVKIGQESDLDLLAFSMGAFGTGSVLLQNSAISVYILVIGIILLVISALLIGAAIGMGVKQYSNKPVVPIVLGTILLFGGVLNIVFIEQLAFNYSQPLLFMGLGIVFIIFGIFRTKKTKGTN